MEKRFFIVAPAVRLFNSWIPYCAMEYNIPRPTPGDANMSARPVIAACFGFALICAANAYGAGSEIADAAMNKDIPAVRSLLRQKADVNAPQADGATALHWAVQLND